MSGGFRRNSLKNARLRLSVWEDGKQTRVAVVAAAVPALTLSSSFKSVKVFFSSVVRNRTRTSHVKSLRYQLFQKAHQDAVDKGFDDALLLNAKKCVVEAAYANVFIVKKGVLMTPPVVDGCLNGVTRKRLIVLAREKGILVRIASLKKKDLLRADEIFLTNSVSGVMPVIQLEEQEISEGEMGTLTKDLCQSYLNYILKSI